MESTMKPKARRLSFGLTPDFTAPGRRQFTIHAGIYWGMSLRWMRDIEDKLMLVGVVWYPTGYDTIIKNKWVLGYRYFTIPGVACVSIPIFVVGFAACVLA